MVFCRCAKYSDLSILDLKLALNVYSFDVIAVNAVATEENDTILPEIIPISQRRRFKPVEIVDEIILLDKEWRQRANVALKGVDSILHKERYNGKVCPITQFDEELYKLKLPYYVVAIVSGALNDAAAKKYSMIWKHGFLHQPLTEAIKQYCHLLNSTLTATERTLCCILENYQMEVLQPLIWVATLSCLSPMDACEAGDMDSRSTRSAYFGMDEIVVELFKITL
ncbi:serine--tRNA ligase [Tanacetum coccineum]|uniref:Serine--tRNA ligase n=1 Tax=Tanacetum coccineum TaxID=301880 RepID=A0ABQ5GQT3_9ASTR